MRVKCNLAAFYFAAASSSPCPRMYFMNMVVGKKENFTFNNAWGLETESILKKKTNGGLYIGLG